jgi:dihydroflavonol-4-reductase
MPSGDLVLVTGASGFIAKQCVAALLAAGYRVRGTVRRPERGVEVRAAIGPAGQDENRLGFATADLLSDAGWDAAVEGCRYVLHVASVFPLHPPRDREALVPVARDGTLRVLRAASRAGVARTVVTSSIAAIRVGHPPDARRVFTEADWTNLDVPDLSSYAVSKTRAERAAWEFIAAEGTGMELAVINPGLVLGPPLDGPVEDSGDLVRMMLTGKMPMLPPISLPIVDVRDVAAAHLAAMGQPEAAGQRFICSGGSLSFRRMSEVLAARFPRFRRRLPRREIPPVVLGLAKRLSRRARVALSEGVGGEVSAEKARRVLGLSFRPPEEALVEMAAALIARGV